MAIESPEKQEDREGICDSDSEAWKPHAQSPQGHTGFSAIDPRASPQTKVSHFIFQKTPPAESEQMKPAPHFGVVLHFDRARTTNRGMKSRHAAALAFWYLMSWPLKSTGYLDKTAPVSTWQVEDTFNSKSECEAGRYKPYQSTEHMLKVFLSTHPDAENMVAARWRVRRNQLAAAQCVSSYDPRLKSN
jgi:hypothetical protein